MVISPELEYAAYANRGLLKRVHPVVKLVLAVLYLVVNIALAPPSYFVFFGFVAALCLAANVPFRLIGKPLAFSFFAAAALVVAKLHFTKTGAPVRFMLDLYPDAFVPSLAAGLRVVAGVALILVFVATTPLNDILSALYFLKVPKTLIETFLVIYKYIFLLNDESVRLRNAQMMRHGYRGWRLSMESLGALAGMLMLRGISRGSGMVDAMTVRGYRGDIFFPSSLRPLGVVDYVILAVAGMVPLAGFLAGLP